MTHRPPRTFRLAAGLAVSAVSAASHAQVLQWINAAGGSAGTAANWNPAQVPGPASILNFNIGGVYNVSFPAAVPACAQLNANAGNVFMSTLVPHTASTQFALGLVAGSNAAATLTGGSLTSPVVSVASNPTATATLTVSGPQADLFATGAGGTRIGNGGNGTLTISSGGSLRSTAAVTVAPSAGSQGLVSVLGVNGGVRSELTTLDPVDGDLLLGVGGSGTLNVSGGGVVEVADDLIVGPTSGIAATATVSSNALASFIDVAGDARLSRNLTASAAGSGSVTVDDGGVFRVAGETIVGDPDGGTGIFTVRVGGQALLHSLTFDPTHGTLNHTGGSLSISDGVLTPPAGVLTISGAPGDVPEVFLTRSSCTLSSVTRALTVGGANDGILDVGTDSRLDVTAGSIVVGLGAGSSGWLQCQLRGRISQTGGGSFIVGLAGRGTLTLGASGQVSSGGMTIALQPGSSGVVDLRTPNTSLTVGGPLTVGGSSQGGAGALLVGGAAANTGTLDVAGALVVSNPVSSLTIGAGGRVTVAAGATFDGALTMTGGLLEAAGVRLNAASSYPLAGTIGGVLRIATPATTVVLGGDLTLRGAGGVGGLINLGSIEVGDRTLTIAGPLNGGDDLQNCHLGPLGRLVSPHALEVGAGTTLSGDGAVAAPIVNSGTILAQGGGLFFEAMLTGLGEGVGGSAIHFGGTGGFTGAGFFSSTTPILASAGSVIHATGSLAMGSSSVAGGFRSDGRIEVEGSSIVTLRSSDQVVVHDVAFPNGAPDPSTGPSVTCPSGMLANGTITGTGVIGGDSNSRFFAQDAVLSPGTADAPGMLMINGDATLQGSPRCEFDIFDATTHDQIRTLTHLIINPLTVEPGDIILDGTLVLRVAPGHTPTSGETHQLIGTNQGLIGRDGNVIGVFDAVQAPPRWHIVIVQPAPAGGENGVFAVYCPADFNDDGFLDFFDYDDFVACFETGVCLPGADADFNGDGFADFFDYDDFVLAFERGC